MPAKRTALITGAAGGIGSALCEAFTGAGYRVIGTDIKSRPGLACAEFVTFDLLHLQKHKSEVDVFTDALNKALDGTDLGVLVNNAAVQILDGTSRIRIEDWSKTQFINVTAPMLLVQMLLPRLEACRGSVINMASVHATSTKPGFVSYATSKSALVGLTRALAVDLGARVRVNAISPAATATDMLIDGFKENPEGLEDLGKMHPIGRIADPVEVARAAVFLASDNASFITGCCLNIDGGISVRLHDPD